jgi:hypothetical protein
MSGQTSYPASRCTFTALNSLVGKHSIQVLSHFRQQVRLFVIQLLISRAVQFDRETSVATLFAGLGYFNGISGFTGISQFVSPSATVARRNVNVLNHPNFAPPVADISQPTFGRSTELLDQYLDGTTPGQGGLSPIYQIGGPRSMQFALKLSF